MKIALTSSESALLSRIASNSNNKITDIEKSDSQFRVHYLSFGGCGSEAIIYNLGGSMVEAMKKIRELEKSIA
jgi:hypothetical protein